MKRTTLTMEFTTPCFLGGADPKSTAEWRAMSIRGELRWWFRAVAKANDPADLAKKEREVFGDTTRKSPLEVRVGPSPKAVPRGGALQDGRKLSDEGLGREWRDESPATLTRLRLAHGSTNPLGYLGYGCIARQHGGDVFDRSHFAPNATATMTLQWPGNASSPYPDAFHDALWSWLHLGGIGAKSRRGFGSLACVKVEGEPLGDLTSTSREAFALRVKKILELGSGVSGVPDWPRFSSGSRVFLGREGKATWAEAMTCAGAWLIAFRRRYGYPGDSRSYSQGPIANRDYEWATPGGRARRKGLPDRAGFGLPLPFGQGGETVTWGKHGVDHRSASPLHLHVEKFLSDGKASYVPVWTYLPSRPFPDGESLMFKTAALPDPKNFGFSAGQASIVEDFLYDLASSKKNLIEEVK